MYNAKNDVLLNKAEYYRLYHYPICPFSRKIRFLFSYYNIEYIQVIENFWEKRDKFIAINPTGEVPFLAIKTVDIEDIPRHSLIWGHSLIAKFIKDKCEQHATTLDIGQDNIEIEKMVYWFDIKFYNDVTKYILNERIYSWYKNQTAPDQQLLKIARLNLESHLNFTNQMLSNKDYIATNDFSSADISCAMQISSLDYLGEINWKMYPAIKEWYSIIKSKPAFREVLYDTIPSFRPALWYRELDF